MIGRVQLRNRRAGRLLTLVLLLWLPAVGSRAQTPSAGPFVTRHTGTFNGQRIAYLATVGETVLRDGEGQPAASLYSIAYVRDGVENRAARPVLFLFNGGPGSASIYLHMGAFGPKRVELPADPRAEVAPPFSVIDNRYTVLDAADLVFIDPVETGFSRILPGANRNPFYTAAGDARSVAQFIREWCRANGRESSPRFVMGESYGTIRAVLVADDLARTAPLDGVILFGQAVNIVETVQRAGNIVGYAVNLPALTAISWYHGLIKREGRTLPAILDEAYTFAMNDYLGALAQGRALPAAERQRIAARLADLSGISADYYLEHGLVISKQEYRHEVLKDRGLIVGMYDGRYTGPAAGVPPGDPSLKISPAFEAAARQHLVTTLGVTLAEPYRAQDKSAARWDYGNGTPASPFTDFDFPAAISRTMAAAPGFRLMIGTGLYDASTTMGAARYLVARGGFPAERVVLRTYEGGHMAYTNEAALKALTDDVRAFLTRQ